MDTVEFVETKQATVVRALLFSLLASVISQRTHQRSILDVVNLELSFLEITPPTDHVQLAQRLYLITVSLLFSQCFLAY